MKVLIFLLLLFASPVWAWNDPWTDCGRRWGADEATISWCRKIKIGQGRYWQQIRVEEQELAEMKAEKDRR